MKVIVTGGRNYNNKDKVYSVLDSFNPTHIIEGGANGADAIARMYAKEKGILNTSYPANWELHGLSAGPRRNRSMVERNKDATLVAFKGGRGTANCIMNAKDLGLKVYEVVE